MTEAALQPDLEVELVDAPTPTRLIDTHAHIHFDAFAGQVESVLHRSQEAGVGKLISVGVNTSDSRKAVELAATFEQVWASVGVHPHEAEEAAQGVDYLRDLAGRRKVVAIGECGLDFYKSQTSVEVQEQALRGQIELALELELPLIFHVREAFDRFFKIIPDYPGLRGVVHSFTGSRIELEQVLKYQLVASVNGIITFTKDQELVAAIKELPLESMLLETDCPFLSPAPFRGKTNEPARVADIAAAVAELRDQPVDQVADVTTANAERLFLGLK